MNFSEKFDLLKSHIEAYTSKDGAVVQAHDNKVQSSRQQFSEGDSVKITGNVQGSGKKGVIHSTAPSGHFHIVKHPDGSRSSYHESNIQPYEDDDDDDDEDDDDRHGR